LLTITVAISPSRSPFLGDYLPNLAQDQNSLRKIRRVFAKQWQAPALALGQTFFCEEGGD
jgi:hypothetical protein